MINKILKLMDRAGYSGHYVELHSDGHGYIHLSKEPFDAAQADESIFEFNNEQELYEKTIDYLNVLLK